MAKITVLGEVVLDRIHQKGHYQNVFGGSAGNCALALTRIDEEVYLRARFSFDEAGEFLYQSALDCGLNLSQSIRATQRATVVNIFADPNGVPAYDFQMEGSADWEWTRDELELFEVNKSDALIYGSLAAVLDPGFKPLASWVSKAKSQGVVVAFDPNARPSAILPSQEIHVKQRINSLAINANIVKVSQEDCEWIDPTTKSHKLVESWSKLGPELVVLTKGPDGAQAYRHGKCVADISGVKIQVADTVGAGDTLMAWLMSGLLKFSDLIRYDATNLESVLHSAVKAAAITCSRTGCNPPTFIEVSLTKNLQD